MLLHAAKLLDVQADPTGTPWSKIWEQMLTAGCGTQENDSTSPGWLATKVPAEAWSQLASSAMNSGATQPQRGSHTKGR
jgi:hypothetical protein